VSLKLIQLFLVFRLILHFLLKTWQLFFNGFGLSSSSDEPANPIKIELEKLKVRWFILAERHSTIQYTRPPLPS
jgi:hypothetical protein